MIFAIGDIHGCVNELRALLNLLPLTPESTVVFLGDYIDRGGNSKGVIDTIIELRGHCRVVTLKGNHEAMFLDFLDHPGSARAGLFICNGGSATLASYANETGRYELPSEHVAFFRELQLTFEDEHHFFVHAGVPDIPLANLDTVRHAKKLLWLRGSFLSSTYDWGKTVIHGHTPVTEVDIRKNRINVDTGCVFMRRLSAVALPGYQVFSVPRMPVAPPVYLRDLSSRRTAIRFRGTLPVTVYRGAEEFHFETLDYSEVGLYLVDISSLSRDFFSEGDRLRGRIGGAEAGAVTFEGVIVRTHRGDRGYQYAVQVAAMAPVS